jgi:hypothetical protein
MKPSDAPCVTESRRERLQTPNRTSSVGANPTGRETAMSAAETAAKMELKTAKLKMEMAAAKLAYVRAVAAYEAAKSGEDTALGEKTIPSFSTRADEIVKPKGLQQERKQRRRSPAYAKRLQRRRKEREDAKEDKERAAENAVIVRFAARRCSELRVTKRREEKKEELRLPDVETHVAAAVFCDGCYRRQDASKKLSRVYGLVFCSDKCSFARLYER